MPDQTQVKKVFQEFISGKLKYQLQANLTDQSLFDLYQSIQIKNQNLIIVLEELLINANEHGAGQADLLYDVSETQVIFIMKDEGSGIHEKIPLNPRLSDTKGKTSASIIRLALEEGISGTGQIGRGMGLYYLSRFVQDHHGEALIASDRGYVIQIGDHFSEGTLKKDLGSTVIVLLCPRGEVG